jgi:hypothetical protein
MRLQLEFGSIRVANGLVALVSSRSSGAASSSAALIVGPGVFAMIVRCFQFSELVGLVGMVMSRFCSLPVGPLGNASTSQTRRGYL